MKSLLEHAPSTQKQVSTAKVRMLLRNYQDDERTGMVELTSGSLPLITVLLIEGMLLHSGQQIADTYQPVPLKKIPDLLRHAESTLRIVPLPAEGVRAIKAILTWSPLNSPLSSKTSDLPGLINTWSANEESGVVYIRWPDAAGLVILLGQIPPRTGVHVTAQKIQGGAKGLAAIHNHAEGACTVTRYAPQKDTIVSHAQLVPLRLAFAAVTDLVISSYQDLVGSSMTELLINKLNVQATANGWDIKFSTNGVVDTQSFTTLEAARQAYQILTTALEKYIALVIGQMLARSLMDKSLSALSPDIRRSLFQK
ncbi:MAG: hypothetical protein U9R05_03420 [Chloroflexota bacterium]|nr:hypothetical protein [Chloroflexota bacterium]